MRISTQIDTLRKKIKNISEFKEKPSILPREELNVKKKETLNLEDDNLIQIIYEIELLKKLSQMINSGATGFELAYEIEKNHSIKNLIYKGVLFYNCLIEIGIQKFIDVPDKKKADFGNFITIEDTEKYLFFIWLKDTIEKKEKILASFNKQSEDIKELKKKSKLFKICQNCGASISEEEQIVCEKCGSKIN